MPQFKVKKTSPDEDLLADVGYIALQYVAAHYDSIDASNTLWERLRAGRRKTKLHRELLDEGLDAMHTRSRQASARQAKE